jgi:hypothetical protein
MACIGAAQRERRADGRGGGCRVGVIGVRGVRGFGNRTVHLRPGNATGDGGGSARDVAAHLRAGD